jgi:hypothetical protein
MLNDVKIVRRRIMFITKEVILFVCVYGLSCISPKHECTYRKAILHLCLLRDVHVQNLDVFIVVM